MREQAAKSVKWTALSMAVLGISQLIQLILFARFLDPEGMGLFAIVLVVFGFLQAFNDLGVGNAVIQSNTADRRQFEVIYLINIFIGLGLASLYYFLVENISLFLGMPDVEPYLKGLAVAIFLTTFFSLYRALLQKNMRFDIIAKVDFIASFVFVAMIFTLLNIGMGLSSLLYGLIAQYGVYCIIYTLLGSRIFFTPRACFKMGDKEFRSSVLNLYKFGFYQVLERMLNYASTSVDRLLIGKCLGADAVGKYNLAWQIVVFPLSKLNPIVNNISFPLYSKLQDDKKELSITYDVTIKIVSYVTIPFYMFLCHFSEPFVFLVFGSGWDSTATIVSILAVSGALKATSSPGGSLMLSRGLVRVTFYWNLMYLLILCVLFYFLLSNDVDIYVVAKSVVALSFLLTPIWHFIVFYYTGVKYRNVIITLGKLFLFCFFSAFFSRQLIDALSFESSISILFSGLVLFVFQCLIFTYITEGESIKKLFLERKI
jgi:O-antigen/teichoic acid export membrane protein